MRSICVYCGSASGASSVYADAARALIAAMHETGLTLVYGGGNVGLMGIIGDAMMARGGEVIGVTPRALVEREVAHRGLTRLEIVEDMHQRKARMIELGDALIALPGGVGTLEELIEAFVWLQLGYHRKPVGILNVAGYYDPLLAFLRHASDAGFLKAAYLDLLIVESDPMVLVERLRGFRPPTFGKWM